jgi:lysophospholipase L1-like esterase
MHSGKSGYRNAEINQKIAFRRILNKNIINNTMSKQNEQEKEALKRYLVAYLNLEKRYPLLPGAQNPDNVAAFIGLSPAELIESRTNYDDQAEIAAQELLKDEDVLSTIEKLPFKKGDMILAIGDSLTDDLQGWFEILRHVLEISRPDLDLEFVNMGVHEDTSFDALRRINRTVLDAEPEWVIVSLGSFDAMRLHAAPNRTLVSLAEFWENLNSIENAIQQTTKNPIIWITPPPVISELMEKVPLFDGILDESDLAQYREILAGRAGYIIDPRGRRMGKPAEAWNYLPDGFHPSVPGHIETVKALLTGLKSEQKSRKDAGSHSHSHDHDHEHDENCDHDH